MNFHDKLQEMDYEIKEQTDNYVLVIKKKRISDIIIIFDLKEKAVSGYLKPNDIIKELDDITYQYDAFREMKRDLKELADLSHYDII